MLNFGPYFKWIHSKWLFSKTNYLCLRGPLNILGAAEGHWGWETGCLFLTIFLRASLQADLRLGSAITQPGVWVSDLFSWQWQALSHGNLGCVVFDTFSPVFWHLVNTQLKSSSTRVIKIIVLLVILFNMLLR